MKFDKPLPWDRVMPFIFGVRRDVPQSRLIDGMGNHELAAKKSWRRLSR